MSEKNWNKYAVALLVEAYQKITSGEADENTALIMLSRDLAYLTDNASLQIDETFRNINGMRWQMANIKKAFIGESYDANSLSQLFVEMIDLYKGEPQEFQVVLNVAHQKIAEIIANRDKMQLDITSEVKELVDYLHSCGVENFCDTPSILFVAYKLKFKRTNDEMSQIKETFSHLLEEQSATCIADIKHGQNSQKENMVQNHESLKKETAVTFTDIVQFNETSYTNADEISLPLTTNDILRNYPVNDLRPIDQQVDVTVVSKTKEVSVKDVKEYSIDNIPFDQITIQMLNLSVRAFHTLQKLGISFLKDLYTADFQSVRNCGQKTIDELNAVKEKYASRLTEKSATVLPHLEKNKAKLINYIYKRVGLHSDLVFEDNSDWDQKAYYFGLVDQSIELLGEEMCAFAIEQPQVCNSFFFALDDIVGNTRKTLERISDIKRSIATMPKKQLGCAICPLLRFYQKYIGNIADTTIDMLSNGHYFVKDLKRLREIDEEEYLQLKPFLAWLHFDVFALTNDFVNMCLKVKKYVANVITKRANGMTLEAIAKEENLTRERIRQIERKGIDKANQIYSQYHLVELVGALCNDDKILREDEIKAFFGDKVQSEELIYLLSSVHSDDFVYDRQLKLFNLIKEKHYDKNYVEKKVKELPELIWKKDWGAIIKALACEIDVEQEYVSQIALSVYSKYDNYYAVRKMPLTAMYEYVIKEHYPNGIKLYTEETNRFRQLVRQDFGENVELPPKNRAIDAAIPRVSVLCDRGTYIHKSHIRVDQKLIERIDLYLEQMPRTAISYAELFRVFQDDLLLTTNITNRFYLQGVLRLNLWGKYYFLKDLISKDRNITVDDELDAFVRDRGQVSRKEILREFEGLRESAICQMLIRCPKIIGINNAEYIHASTLNIQDTDYEIRDIILDNIKGAPLSARKLLEILYAEKIDFLERNNITTHAKLFGILRYMFKEEFAFSSPYIAQKGLKNVTNLSVLLSLLEGYSKITIDELMSIVEENRLSYFSTNSLVESLNDSFLRVNDSLLISVDELSFDDSDVAKINDYIEGKLQAQDFVSLKTFTDWIWLPDISFEWNSFLLRSILQKYNDSVVFVDYPHSDSQAMTTILVRADLGIDDYLSLVKYAAQKENSMCEFISFKEFYDWLSETGLIGNDIPSIIINNFLEILPDNRLKLIKNG